MFSYAWSIRTAFYAVQLAAAALLVAAPILADAIPSDGSSRNDWFQRAAPYMPFVAIYFGAYLLSPLMRKRHWLGIGLSSAGVYHWSWFGCCFFRWEWISAVQATGKSFGVGRHHILLTVAEPAHRSENREENWVSGFGFYRKKLRTIPAGFLSVNPASCYYALHYYLRHPEKRDELGTDAALERMRTLDFPDIIAEIKRYGDVRSR